MILTVPVSVLQASPGEVGAIEFDPPLRAKRDALARIHMGSVVRVTLRLSERFWASDWFAKQIETEELDMLNNIGLPGLLLLAVVVLVLFGRGKVAGLMGEVGKGITSFKRGLNEGKAEIENAAAERAHDITPEKDKVRPDV